MTAAPPTRGVVLDGPAFVYDLLEPPMMLFRHGAMVRAVVDALAPRDGERILDVGCGTGTLAAAIARRLAAGRVDGIDAAPRMVATANRKHGDDTCRFTVAVAEDLPFTDAVFDAAVSSLFFHHVDADLKARAVAEILRVLKPGGRLVVADMDRPWNLLGKLWGWGGYVLFHQPEIRENLEGRLPEIMAAAGVADLRAGATFLGCIRVWEGHKS